VNGGNLPIVEAAAAVVVAILLLWWWANRTSQRNERAASVIIGYLNRVGHARSYEILGELEREGLSTSWPTWAYQVLWRLEEDGFLWSTEMLMEGYNRPLRVYAIAAKFRAEDAPEGRTDTT
jgi:hypothetical protein